VRNSRRVLILADGDNIFLAAQSFNRRLEWQKIRDYLADPKEGRELIEMVIYIGMPPARERFEEQRKTKEKFIYWAKSNGEWNSRLQNRSPPTRTFLSSDYEF
jgi:hypothetical protein